MPFSLLSSFSHPPLSSFGAKIDLEMPYYQNTGNRFLFREAVQHYCRARSNPSQKSACRMINDPLSCGYISHNEKKIALDVLRLEFSCLDVSSLFAAATNIHISCTYMFVTENTGEAYSRGRAVLPGAQHSLQAPARPRNRSCRTHRHSPDGDDLWPTNRRPLHVVRRP